MIFAQIALVPHQGMACAESPPEALHAIECAVEKGTYGRQQMATLAEWQARKRASLFDSYDRGIVTASELFPAVLDTFTDGRIAEEMTALEPEVRDKLKDLLSNYEPESFVPFLIGSTPSPDESKRWEEERRRKYAAILACLGIDGPQAWRRTNASKSVDA